MKYEYLKNEGTPWMIEKGLELLGTKEVKGSVNNETILSWAKEVGGKIEDIYKADEIPWCGLAMAIVAKRAKKPLPINPLWALNWNTFGTRVEKDEAILGDILVFVRNGGGHVGLYVGEDEDAFHVMGGNQSDSFCITRIAKKRLYGVRRPHYSTLPKNAKKFIISNDGQLSINEK